MWVMRFRQAGSVALCLPLLLVPACGGGSSTKKPKTAAAEMSAQDKVRMAQSLIGAGRTGEAMRLLEEALVQEPESDQLQLYYGKVCYQAGQLDRAERGLLRALEIEPYLTDAHNLLGAVYANTDRLAEAEREFLTALADPAYPTPEMVYLNLALLYSGVG
jgi:type IV pilus assembly protein PilF